MMSGSKGQNPIVLARNDKHLLHEFATGVFLCNKCVPKTKAIQREATG